MSKFLDRMPSKHETRTDWRRRPLSKRQVEYALNDAQYLPPLRDKIHAKLEELGRLAWLEEEMTTWQETIERSMSHERWRRVSGNAALDAGGLAIIRELFHWRDAEAQRRNQPARRILRDDLIVELARRGSADPNRIRAVRGMERGDLQRRLAELAAAIQRGLRPARGRSPDPRPAATGAGAVGARPVPVRRLGQHLPRGAARSQHRRHAQRHSRVDRLSHGPRPRQVGANPATRPRMEGRVRGPLVRRFIVRQALDPRCRAAVGSPVGVRADVDGDYRCRWRGVTAAATPTTAFPHPQVQVPTRPCRRTSFPRWRTPAGECLARRNDRQPNPLQARLAAPA